MTLKIKITPREMFDVSAGDESLGVFRLVSKWEGMIKLQGEAGTLIVMDDSEEGFNIFDKIFGSGNRPESTEHDIVKASPTLLNRIAVLPDKG